MSSQVVRNYSRLPRLASAGVLVPCLLMPLAILAVAGVPGFELWSVQEDLEQTEIRAVRALELRQELRALRPEESPEALLPLRDLLHELLPETLDPVAVHGTVRRAANAAGVQLAEVRPGTERGLGLEVGGESVQALELTLTGRTEPARLLALLGELRRAGAVPAVRALQLQRSGAAGSGDLRDFELRLELLRRSPIQSEAPSPEEEMPR